GPVRVAKRVDPGRIQIVLRDCRANETGQLLGLRAHFLRIKHALGQTLEEAMRAIFSDIAARAQDGGARSYCLADSYQIVLVAPGSVENYQCFPRCRVLCGHEAV